MMMTSPSKQIGMSKIEWIMIVLIIAIIGSVVVSMEKEGERTRQHMETVTVPLIEALDRYREANESYPESLDELVPMYLPNAPSCSPKSADPSFGFGYSVDKDSGEYDLFCGIGMFRVRYYR